MLIEILLRVLEQAKDRNEKKACQTSIDTHPVHATEVSLKRDKIIATLYTVNSKLNAAIFADSSRVKASLLGIEDRLIVQVGDSVAFLRSSEEDVNYRIDSMTVGRKNGQQFIAR